MRYIGPIDRAAWRLLNRLAKAGAPGKYEYLVMVWRSKIAALESSMSAKPRESMLISLRLERVPPTTYLRVLFFSLFLLSSSAVSICRAQDVLAQKVTTSPGSTASDIYRLQNLPVDGGAELITLHAK